MKRSLIAMLIAGAATVAILALPLYVGVWLPDVIFSPTRTLAEKHLASGHSFRVIQYWNKIDFYTAELRHTRPSGLVEFHVLDGDDDKSWRVPLIIDENSGTAAVTLSGGRVKTLVW